MEYEKDVSNLTFENDVTPSQSLEIIAHEIVFVLFSIVAMCADVAIIYTIFRFNRIRSTENIFIANWAIADLCSLIVAPSGYRIISVIENLPLSPEFVCAVFQIGSALHVTVMLFVIVVAIDWFIGAYFEKASDKFRSHYKYVIGSVWIFSLLMSSFSTGYCLHNKYSMFSNLMLISSFFAILLITIVLQSSRAVRKYYLKNPLDYPTLTLTLSTAFALTWFLAFLTVVLFNVAIAHPLIGIITECLVFCSAIVNFVLLYRLDQDFQACLLQVFKCSGNRYEDSICNFNNPITIVTDKPSAEISFDNPSANLITDDVY